MVGLVWGCLGFCVLGLIRRLLQLANRRGLPTYSRARGRTGAGVIYAYTLGLAPWSKESTRRHPIVYVRGILFHIGILAALILLVLNLLMWTGDMLIGFWLWLLSGLAVVGALCGWIGLGQRLVDPELRRLNIFDDYLAVTLVTVFLTLTAVTAWQPGWSGLYWVVAALLLVYIPLGKITHLVYWIYIRYRFGSRYGRRGIIPKPIVWGEGQRHEC